MKFFVESIVFQFYNIFEYLSPKFELKRVRFEENGETPILMGLMSCLEVQQTLIGWVSSPK